MIITYIQLLIFILYITFIISKFGILHSISESWYKLEENKKGTGILFTAFLWITGFLMFFHTNGSSGFFFASGAGLMFIGAATQYEEEITKKVHYIGALAGLLFPLIAVWYERSIWIPFTIASLVCLISLIIKLKNETWWLEIAIILLILLGLLL